MRYEPNEGPEYRYNVTSEEPQESAAQDKLQACLKLLVVQATLDRFGKFDLALFQRLVHSSQLLAAHPRGPLRHYVVGSAVTFRIFERS